MVLLLLPVVPGIGYEINGARLWAAIGPITFQPAEFGKIFIVVFLAAYLADKRELLASGVGRFGLPRAKDLGPLLVAWIASLAVLFLERDMGASLLFFGVFVVMLWIASGRAGYLWLGIILFVVGAWLGYLAFDHVQTRVDYWIHALDPAVVTGQGYFQLAQGWFALATGGIVGTGIGQGSPTLIPYVGSDFIFAAFGEELGMIGAVSLLLLYLVLDRARAAGGDGARRCVRQAAGHRHHHDHRAADVRDRGGGDAVDPAHRGAPAVGELRGFEPRRHLHHAGAAGAGVGGTSGAAAWIGASAAWASGSWHCSDCCSRNSHTSRCSRPTTSRDRRRTPGARSSPSTRWSAGRS